MRRLLFLLPLLLLALPACDSNDNDPDFGTVADANSVVVVAYEGRLQNGTVFDSNSRAEFPLANTITGFRNGVAGMEIGETKTFSIPPQEAYGSNPPPGSGIPPNATLVFEVTLLDIVG